MSLLTLFLLFAAGAALDGLHAGFVRLVNTKHYFWASVVSFVITILGYTVFFAIIESLSQGRPDNLVAYAMGGFFGSWGVLRWKTAEAPLPAQAG